MKGDNQTNKPEGSKPLETKHDDKPTNVTMTTGSVGWLSRLLQLAIIIAFVGCFQSVYKHVTTMEQRIKELEVKQETSENKINDLEMEIAALHLKLSSVINETQDNRKLLDTTEGGLNKTNTFVKEFYKNFTITNTLTGDHNSSIQYLYNFTDVINETLVRVKDEQEERIISITQRFEKTEGCQSGYEVGEHTYPAQAFPLERTVKFDPPFKEVPAFSYGATLLDSTSHLSVNLQLVSLTPESFTIKFHTWGKKYALYGARISWMACPK